MDKNQKILIVDDSEMNRAILADILGGEYAVLEARDGVEAVAELRRHAGTVSLVLLDMVMPRMDGFGVLEAMNGNGWTEEIPVIVISAQNGPELVSRAYDLGACDFIGRPFDVQTVRRRVMNTLLMYAKQRKLTGMVEDQIREKNRQNGLMIDILSHIVEFRNGESAAHVPHVHRLTDLLLRALMRRTGRYGLTDGSANLIATASALHDIGKVAIDGSILNKPGRLTDTEFAVMKTHAGIGADMLEGMPEYRDDPLVRTARDICRWHHERWDGRGYPDGLKGDDIPVSAQIVALADVYDALTSERVYKGAIPHGKAMEMIMDGQCGAFSPLLLDCLRDVGPLIANGAPASAPGRLPEIPRPAPGPEDMPASGRTLRLLEREREKYGFFAAMSREIQFEYDVSPSMLTLSPWGARQTGLPEIVMHPEEDPGVLSVISREAWDKAAALLRAASPDDPIIRCDARLNAGGKSRWHKIIARAMWTADEPPEYQGAIGKIIDVHDSLTQMQDLEHAASHDGMTGLLNRKGAEQLILERLANPLCEYAMVILDLDYFKQANDTYGHMFGDEVLVHVSGLLRRNLRGTDLAARAGGDEFIALIRYSGDEVRAAIARVFGALSGRYKDFGISVSMGVSTTQTAGRDYADLFRAADQALYAAKRSGRGQYRFYDPSAEQDPPETPPA